MRKMYYPEWMATLSKSDTQAIKKQRRKEFLFILEMGGLFMNWDRRYYILNMIYVGFLFFVLSYHLPCFMITMSKVDHLAAKGQYLNFGSLIIIAQSMIVTFNSKRKTLLTLFSMTGDGFHDYGVTLNKTEIAKLENRFNSIRRKIFVILPSWLCLVGATVLGSDYVNIIFASEVQAREGYVNGVYQNLPLKMWYFYPINSELVRKLTIAAGGICAFEMALSIGGATLMLIYFGHSLILEMKTLIVAIRDTDSRADNHYISTLGKKPPRCPVQRRKDARLMRSYKICFRQTMEHHKAIINFFEMFGDVINVSSGISVVLAACLMGMSTITLVRGGGQANYILTSCLLLIAEIASLFILCEIGQTIRDMSEEMFHVMYKHVKWSDVSKEVVGDMRIMRFRMAKPLVLLGFSAPLERATFGRLLANSIFNVLRGLGLVSILKKRKKAEAEAELLSHQCEQQSIS